MKKNDKIKLGLLIVVILVTGVLSWNISKVLPTVGDPDTPANGQVSDYYILNAISQTHSPNLVTAVLADYRAFDTLFETCVLFMAAVVVVVTLSSKETVKKSMILNRDIMIKARKKNAGFRSMIFDISFRVVIPVLAIYAIYVLLHGEVSLGGGFQAGAVLACAYLLDRISPDVDTILGRMSEGTALIVAGLGAFLYAFTGILCMMGGGNFLEYSTLPFGAALVKEVHSIGIFMIEVGVTVCVMAVIIGILEMVLERTEFDD